MNSYINSNPESLGNNLVSVVIPNYNGKELLKDCIESIRGQTHKLTEIIIVDAGSKDGSVEYVKNNFQDVQIVLDAENHGLTYGQNLGIKHSTGSWVLIMNNDTRLDPACIEYLLEAAIIDPTIGMVAAKILLPRMDNRIDSAGFLIHRDMAAINRGHMQQDKGQFDKREEVFGPSDAAALLNRMAVDSAGGYDNDYFYYCEEADISFRLRLQGWICVYEPRAVAFHMYSSTVGEISERKVFYSERNNIWNLLKNMPFPLLIEAIPFLCKRYVWLARAAYEDNGSSRASQFREKQGILPIISIFVKIIYTTIIYLPIILRKRKEILSKRKVSNKEVRRWFKRFGADAKHLYIFSKN